MSEMFANCDNLIYINGISKLKKTKIINQYKMFYNCTSLLSIPDFNDWKISTDIDNYLMFYNCISLAFFPYKKEFNFKKYDNAFLGIIITKYLKCNNEITIKNIIDNNGNINLIGKEINMGKNDEITIIDGIDDIELIACYKEEKKTIENQYKLKVFYNNDQNDKKGKEKEIKLRIINKMKDIYQY